MRWLCWQVGVAALVTACMGVARADVVLSLTTDRPLASAQVGDVVTFRVNVQLTAGEQLDTLTTKVLFTNGFFNLSQAVAPGLLAGGVIADPSDFFAAPPDVNNPPGIDSVDGSFLGILSGNEINQGGTFFTFAATVLRSGSPAIGFDPASTLAGTVGGGSVTPTAPAPQPVAVASVPEPASLLLWVGICAVPLTVGSRRGQGGLRQPPGAWRR